jgi:hypothetical protein
MKDEIVNFGAAYHEAGHALLIVRLDVWSPGWRIVLPGAPLWSAGSAARRGIAGIVLPPDRAFDAEDPPPRRGRFLSRGNADLDLFMRESAARRAIMDAAGVAAGFPTSRRWSRAHEQSSYADMRSAETEFRGFGFDPPMPWHTLIEAALEMVDREWGAIEAIVVPLHRHRQLSSDQVIELIETAKPRRNPWRAQAPCWLEHNPVEIVAQQLTCWRRRDWVEEDRLAAMNEVDE